MARQFCTFSVGDLFLGIEVSRIQEVLRGTVVTPIPLSPPAIKGLINLRGQIVTAIDLRKRFDLPPASEDIAITTIILRSGKDLLSLVVDKVGDVVEVERGDFEKAPETLKGEARKLIKGAYKLERTLLLVLDVEHALDLDGRKASAGSSDG